MDSLSQFFSDHTVRSVVKALSARHEADIPIVREAKNLLRAGDIGRLSELNPAPSSFETAPDYLVFAHLRDLFR